MGPKGQLYDVISPINPDVAAWSEHPKQPGNQGEWKAQLIAIDDVESFIDKLFDDYIVVQSLRFDPTALNNHGEPPHPPPDIIKIEEAGLSKSNSSSHKAMKPRQVFRIFFV